MNMGRVQKCRTFSVSLLSLFKWGYSYTRSNTFCKRLSREIVLSHSKEQRRAAVLCGHGTLFPEGQGGTLSKEGNPSYLTNRKMVLYWSNPRAIFLTAKIKTFISQNGSRTASLLASRSCNLPEGVMSHLL